MIYLNPKSLYDTALSVFTLLLLAQTQGLWLLVLSSTAVLAYSHFHKPIAVYLGHGEGPKYQTRHRVPRLWLQRLI